jgi:hypothetical protein
MRRPPAAGLIPELPHLPAGAQGLETAAATQPLDGDVLLGHDRVAHSLPIEELDHAFAVEARVTADAKPRAGEPRVDLREADPKERDGPGRRHRVPRAQAPVPELLAVRLEAAERPDLVGWHAAKPALLV